MPHKCNYIDIALGLTFLNCTLCNTLQSVLHKNEHQGCIIRWRQDVNFAIFIECNIGSKCTQWNLLISTWDESTAFELPREDFCKLRVLVLESDTLGKYTWWTLIRRVTSGKSVTSLMPQFHHLYARKDNTLDCGKDYIKVIKRKPRLE